MVFFDQDGKVECTFVYDDHEMNQDGKHLLCKEFTTASVNHTGKSVVIGNFDSFYLYSYNDEINTWQEFQLKIPTASLQLTGNALTQLTVVLYPIQGKFLLLM